MSTFRFLFYFLLITLYIYSKHFEIINLKNYYYIVTACLDGQRIFFYTIIESLNLQYYYWAFLPFEYIGWLDSISRLYYKTKKLLL